MFSNIKCFFIQKEHFQAILLKKLYLLMIYKRLNMKPFK